MANNGSSQKTKHFSGFWPIFIIVIVAAVAAVIVYLYANGNILQDQVDSTTFWSHWQHKPAVKKAPVKKSTKTSTTTAQ